MSERVPYNSIDIEPNNPILDGLSEDIYQQAERVFGFISNPDISKEEQDEALQLLETAKKRKNEGEEDFSALISYLETSIDANPAFK